MLAAENLARPMRSVEQEIIAMKIHKPATLVKKLSVSGLRQTGTSLEG